MGAVEHVWARDRQHGVWYGHGIVHTHRSAVPDQVAWREIAVLPPGVFVSPRPYVVVPQCLFSQFIFFRLFYRRSVLSSPVAIFDSIVIRICPVHAGRAHRNYASDCPVRAVARSRPTASRQWIQCGPGVYLAVVLVTRSACPYSVSCIALTPSALVALRLDRSPNAGGQSINNERPLGSLAGAFRACWLAVPFLSYRLTTNKTGCGREAAELVVVRANYFCHAVMISRPRGSGPSSPVSDAPTEVRSNASNNYHRPRA